MRKTEVCLDIFDRAYAQAAQSVWSMDKPTKAGWYWFRFEGGKERIVQVYHHVDGGWCMAWPQIEHGQIAVLIRSGGSFDELVHQGGEWAGPLPMPREA